MIVPDVNLLVYAYDSRSPYFEKAKEWWQEALSGVEVVGIPSVALLGFVRIVTHPSINEEPMSIDDARSRTLEWLERPNVEILSAGRSTFVEFFRILGECGNGGNATTDALIAAHAVECQACVHSNDADFGRMSGVKWTNPLK